MFTANASSDFYRILLQRYKCTLHSFFTWKLKWELISGKKYMTDWIEWVEPIEPTFHLHYSTFRPDLSPTHRISNALCGRVEFAGNFPESINNAREVSDSHTGSSPISALQSVGVCLVHYQRTLYPTMFTRVFWEWRDDFCILALIPFPRYCYPSNSWPYQWTPPSVVLGLRNRLTPIHLYLFPVTSSIWRSNRGELLESLTLRRNCVRSREELAETTKEEEAPTFRGFAP